MIDAGRCSVLVMTRSWAQALGLAATAAFTAELRPDDGPAVQIDFESIEAVLTFIANLGFERERVRFVDVEGGGPALAALLNVADEARQAPTPSLH